jgi:hypothetical protein
MADNVRSLLTVIPHQPSRDVVVEAASADSRSLARAGPIAEPQIGPVE